MAPATTSSEIDDIFSRKAKTTTLQTNQHSSSDLKQKRRKKKRSETQTPAAEIVLDPSLQPSHASKTIQHDRSVPPKKKRKIVDTKLDQDGFRDSRGTGPRKRVLCHELRWALNHSQAAKPMKGLRYLKKMSWGLMQRPEVSSTPHFCEFIHISLGTPSCPFDCDCCKCRASVSPGKLITRCRFLNLC